MSDNDNDQHDQSFGFGDDIDNIEALSDNGEFEKMMDEGLGNDDDEDDGGLPVLIRYDGQPTEEGFVFRKIPAMPADADTTPYFSDEFIAACLEAHETHCAMQRRLFEDIERVALHEEKLARQAARRATFKGLDTEVTPGGSSNASPTLSHRRSVTETTTTRSPSVGNFSNLFSSALFAAASPLGGTYGSPQYLTSQSSFRPSSLHRSVDDATRDDDASSTSSVTSMDEWRKTVVVPPRSPSPPPADPGRRESDVPLSSFLPAIHGASSMRSPLRASVSAAADERRLEPIEVLYANRLLSSLTTVDVDALAAKGIVELIRLKPGLEIAREGEPSYATHALIIVNGGATLMRRGRAVSTFSTQCHVLLEEECRGSPGSHRSLATLVVAEPDGLQAWAVPRVLVQRITMAVQVQRRRISRRQEPSS